MSISRKKIYNTAMKSLSMESKTSSTVGPNTNSTNAPGNEDSNLSTVSVVSSNNQWDGIDKSANDKKNNNNEDEEEDDEEHENDSGNDSDPMEEIPDEEDDKRLNADDAPKTLDRLQRQMNQVRQDLFETAQQVRGYNCGQDRYQRTMWVLPHAGGPYLEGLSSCDYTGRHHFPLIVPTARPKNGFSLKDVPYPSGHSDVKTKRESTGADRDVDMTANNKMSVIVEKGSAQDDEKDVLVVEHSKSLGRDDKMDGIVELVDPIGFKPINGQLKDKSEEPADKSNHKSIFEEDVPDIPPKKNRKVAPAKPAVDKKEELLRAALGKNATELYPLNGLKDATESQKDQVDKDLVATGLGLIPGQFLRAEHIAQCEKMLFCLLPRRPCDVASICKMSLNVPIPKAAETPHPDSPVSRSSCPESPNVNPNSVQNLSHKELLERLHQSAEALPIPAEYKTGWWVFSDVELLKKLHESLNERGVRERELKRFLEKNYNIVKNAIEKVDVESVTLDPLSQSESQAMLYDDYGTPVRDEPNYWAKDLVLKVDVAVLETVYNMEEKITNASMQNKNWKLGDSNDRPNYTFRPSCLLPTDPDDTRKNAITIGRERLLAIEEGIERRYLKPPLVFPPHTWTETGSQSLSIPLSWSDFRIGTSPNLKSGASSGSGNGDSCSSSSDWKSESTKGLTTWREAVSNVKTAAQLAMCTYVLETAVAWDKSIMKAYCQFCHSGDFEEKLLLCDGCDKGYHTHCFKPAMENIPDGDWYCFECVNKFSEGSQRHCLVCGGTEGRNLVSCSTCYRAYHTTCITPALLKIPRSKWSCPACSSKSPRGRRGRTKKTSESSNNASNPTLVDSAPREPLPTGVNNSTTDTPPPTSSSSSPSSPSEVTNDDTNASSGPATATTPKKKKKTTQPPPKDVLSPKDQRDLGVCKGILADLETHDDSWPFLLPVNTRQFPTYKKIIKRPMDLSTIRKRLDEASYKNRDEYSDDLRLMFNNCEIFNEDDSPVGKAGHNLRSFFEAKWNENFPSV